MSLDVSGVAGHEIAKQLQALGLRRHDFAVGLDDLLKRAKNHLTVLGRDRIRTSVHLVNNIKA